jgi:hypothetical protein
VPLRVHGDPTKVPVVLVNVTVPVGVDAVPVAVSVTVAVHVADWPVVIVFGVQLTVVLVDRALTVTAKLAVLPLWLVSPL